MVLAAVIGPCRHMQDMSSGAQQAAEHIWRAREESSAQEGAAATGLWGHLEGAC